MLKFNIQLLRVYYLWDKRSFKKAINVTYFVTLSSEVCTHSRMYFRGRLNQKVNGDVHVLCPAMLKCSC